MANDTYSAASGQGIYGGRFDTIKNVAQGGTVNVLAKDVASRGFTLLSTAPAASIFRNNGHAGMAFDEDRMCAWIFGAETHNLASDYDNSVYCFDTRDGLFKKIYNQDPWPAEYNINADGYLYSDFSFKRPWAMHAYRRLIYDIGRKALLVVMDANFHSYTTPQQLGSVTIANRRCPIWVFNTVTQTWSVEHTSAIQSFVSSGNIVGAAYSPIHGYAQIPTPNLNGVKPDGSFYTKNVYNKANAQYHDSTFIVGDILYKFLGNGQTNLFSRHNLTNDNDYAVKLQSEYPALSGWDTKNKPAVPVSETQIIFFAQAGNVISAFSYSITNDTVEKLSHELTGVSTSAGYYEFKVQWSERLGGIVYITGAYGTTRAYLLRL